MVEPKNRRGKRGPRQNGAAAAADAATAATAAAGTEEAAPSPATTADGARRRARGGRARGGKGAGSATPAPPTATPAAPTATPAKPCDPMVVAMDGIRAAMVMPTTTPDDLLRLSQELRKLMELQQAQKQGFVVVEIFFCFVLFFLQFADHEKKFTFFSIFQSDTVPHLLRATYIQNKI
jgi:pyruvate/2-oxoglutarate dehydrogenase complex dihydrolipoamide acyltransferase (E2) component